MRTLLDEILESPSAILGEVLGGKDDRKPVTYFAPWIDNTGSSVTLTLIVVLSFSNTKEEVRQDFSIQI